MRKLVVAFLSAGVAGSAIAQVVYDNGPWVTHANGGFNNAPRSVLQNSSLLLNTFGFGCQKLNQNRVADDVVVPAGARMRVTGFRFLAYQTTATSNTINDANVRVWNGAPNGGGSVVAGNPVTNIFSSATSTGTYRVDDLTGGATVSSRLVMEVSTNLASPFTMAPGTYWVDWQLAGSLASGPWQVPVTILGQTAKPGANGLQFLGSTNAWQNANDTSGPRQDMAFKVIGVWLLNPATYTVSLGTPFGGNVASLASSDNNRAIVLMDENDSNSQVNMTLVSPSSTATVLVSKVEWSSSRNDLSQFFTMQNVSNTYEQIDFSVSTLTDVVRTTTISGNPQRFIRPGNQVVSRVATIPTADIDSGDGWTHQLDWVEFELTP